MPMSGSNYVAPTWVDKAPPALDAAELQAMCNTIEQNQGDAAALQAALQALTTTVSGKAQIVTGSYVGTGTYGSGNPNVINTPFPAKVLIVSGAMENNLPGTTGAVKDIGAIHGSASQRGFSFFNLTWTDEKVLWYGTSASGQMNTTDQTYFYAIFG